MNDVAGMITHLMFIKINELNASTLFKKNDLEVAMTVLLGEVVTIRVRNIPHKKRTCTALQIMCGQLGNMGNG